MFTEQARCRSSRKILLHITHLTYILNRSNRARASPFSPPSQVSHSPNSVSPILGYRPPTIQFSPPFGPGIVPAYPSTATRLGTGPLPPIIRQHRRWLWTPPYLVSTDTASGYVSFLSTHWCSPTSLSSHGSGHSLGSTMVTANDSTPPQAARNFDRNHTHTPSWNSAMTRWDQVHLAAPKHTLHEPRRLAALTIAVPQLRTNGRTSNSQPFVQGYWVHEAQIQASPCGSSVSSTSPRVLSGRVYRQQEQRAPVFGNAGLTST